MFACVCVFDRGSQIEREKRGKDGCCLFPESHALISQIWKFLEVMSFKHGLKFDFKVWIPWFQNCKYVASDSCLFKKNMFRHRSWSAHGPCQQKPSCSKKLWVKPYNLWGNDWEIRSNKPKANLLPTCQQPSLFSQQLYVHMFSGNAQAWGQLPKQIQTHICYRGSGICVLKSFVFNPQIPLHPHPIYKRRIPSSH